MGELRQSVDPELHTLRSIARGIEDARGRQEAESARFSLYAALEGEDRDSAKRWLRALRVALQVHVEAEMREAARCALDEISEALG